MKNFSFFVRTMRLPLLFEEILKLTDEKDEEEYLMINSIYEITKNIAGEVNRKKASFKKIKEIESQIEKDYNNFYDSFPELSLMDKPLPAKSHNFKVYKLLLSETCIVCNNVITTDQEPVKCIQCGFWAHKSCTFQSSKNNFNYLNNIF